MNLGKNYRRVSLVYQKPEIRVSVEIILSVFATLFLVLTAIRPTLVTVAELKKKIEDQTLVERKLDTKIKRLIQARKQLDLNEGNLPLFEKAVPENYTYADLAKKIEILASEREVEIESLVFSSVVVSDEDGKNLGPKKKDEVREWKNGNNTVKEFSINFSVMAEEVALMNFLEDLEKLDRIMLISTIDITKVKDRDVVGDKLRAGGKISGYYLIAEGK